MSRTAFFSKKDHSIYRFLKNTHEICHETLHYIFLYKAIKKNELFPGKFNQDFVTLTINAYYDTAVKGWCMIFGSYNEDLHYTKLLRYKKIKSRLARILDVSLENLEIKMKEKIIEASRLNENEYKHYHSKTKKYRDKYLVHRALFPEQDQDFESKHPLLDPILSILVWYLGFITKILNQYDNQSAENIYTHEYRDISNEQEIIKIFSDFNNTVRESFKI